MKTVEQAASECIKQMGLIHRSDGVILHAFKACVEFANTWISVDEELPKVGEKVIVMFPNNNYECATMYADGSFYRTTFSSNFEFALNVTHWRPIELK